MVRIFVAGMGHTAGARGWGHFLPCLALAYEATGGRSLRDDADYSLTTPERRTIGSLEQKLRAE
ncbi:MAG: hypothetical protein AB7H80_11380 [Candidatus Kapaibacterium sp.]